MPPIIMYWSTLMGFVCIFIFKHRSLLLRLWQQNMVFVVMNVAKAEISLLWQTSWTSLGQRCSTVQVPSWIVLLHTVGVIYVILKDGPKLPYPQTRHKVYTSEALANFYKVIINFALFTYWFSVVGIYLRIPL